MKLIRVTKFCAMFACIFCMQTMLSHANESAISEKSYFPTTKNDIIRALAPQKYSKSRGISVQYQEFPKLNIPGPKPKVQLRINFALGSARLSETSKFLLYELSEALKSEELKNFKFLIGGHTDSVGSYRYNEKLSIRRANSVKRYLIKTLGIPASRLEIQGNGEKELLDPHNPKSFVNRRVEVTNLGQAKE